MQDGKGLVSELSVANIRQDWIQFVLYLKWKYLLGGRLTLFRILLYCPSLWTCITNLKTC